MSATLLPLEEAVEACAEAERSLARRREESQAAIHRCRRARTEPAVRPAPASPPAPGALTAEQVALVEDHRSLALALARRYDHRGERLDDLQQVAQLALVGAARRWRVDRGVPFAGFATPSILGELKRHFRDRSWSMRVPRSTQERYLRVVAEREAFVAEHGSVPTVRDLAARLCCEVEGVVEAVEAGENFRAASIDDPLGPARESMPSSDGGYDGMLERQDLAAALSELGEESQYVVKRRFVDEWPQRRIADELGVSQMYISRLLARVLVQLRAGLAD